MLFRSTGQGTSAVSRTGRYGVKNAVLEATGCPAIGQLTVLRSARTGANGNATAASTPTQPTSSAAKVSTLRGERSADSGVGPSDQRECRDPSAAGPAAYSVTAYSVTTSIVGAAASVRVT